MPEIRKTTESYWSGIWIIFASIVKSGDTYVYDSEISENKARALWMGREIECFVAINNNQIVGTYIIKPNFPALGSHIANCSYMVKENTRGLGIGRKMA